MSVSGRQTVLASATLSPASLLRARRWLPPGRGEPELLSPRAMVPAGPGRVAADPRSRQPGGPGGGHGARPTGPGEPGWGWGAAEDDWTRESGVLTVGSAGGQWTDDVAGDLPPTLTHVVVAVPRGQRRIDTLRRVLSASGSASTVVFLNFGRRIDDAAESLEAKGVACGRLHGELGKEERSAAVEQFKRGKTAALITSDVAARGLDLPTVECVVNFELPSNPQARWGGWGGEGTRSWPRRGRSSTEPRRPPRPPRPPRPSSRRRAVVAAAAVAAAADASTPLQFCY